MTTSPTDLERKTRQLDNDLFDMHDLLKDVSDTLRTHGKLLTALSDTQKHMLVTQEAHGRRLDGLDYRLEDLGGEVAKLDVKLSGRIDELDQRVSGRLDKVSGRLDKVEVRLDGIDGRLDVMHTDFTVKLDQILQLLGNR